MLRDRLAKQKLECFAKVSGSKGIQLYVPLNSHTTYELTQPFARQTAEALAGAHPGLVVAGMSKSLRHGRVFIDWSQNSDFKTTAGVYSLRAKRDEPFVSMPVRWEELRAAVRKHDAASLYFAPNAALARLERIGDLFAPVLTLEQAFDAGPKLDEYRRRRNFAKTAEPPARLPRASRQGGRRRFVVQKHAAGRLHYDFRLEMHGVLKSWAVPKGMPCSPEDKRLAMQTEDHPLEYVSFEGTIPQGQYGGGTVMVWDTGTYELMEGNIYKVSRGSSSTARSSRASGRSGGPSGASGFSSARARR